jgi:hypothetical protein
MVCGENMTASSHRKSPGKQQEEDAVEEAIRQIGGNKI